MRSVGLRLISTGFFSGLDAVGRLGRVRRWRPARSSPTGEGLAGGCDALPDVHVRIDVSGRGQSPATPTSSESRLVRMLEGESPGQQDCKSAGEYARGCS